MIYDKSVNGYYTVSNKDIGSAAASGVLQVVTMLRVQTKLFSVISINTFENFGQVTNKRAVCVILTSIIKYVTRSIDRVHRGVKNFFDEK